MTIEVTNKTLPAPKGLSLKGLIFYKKDVLKQSILFELVTENQLLTSCEGLKLTVSMKI